MPEISIILPAFNAQDTLVHAVESVRAQLFQDWELLLVNDGSTDGTAALCDGFAAEDPRIRVLHKENEGVSCARNDGIAAAQGEWIAFLDADDWYEDAVDFASARGIVNGMSDTEFGHDTTTSRNMVWTMLARLSGVDTSTGENWYDAGREWAMANGISDGTMGDEEITREQLATMLHRFVGAPDSDHDISHFDDHGDTSDWAKVAKQWAVEMGVISGVGQADGSVTLDPQGDATRAQVAQMLMNFIKSVGTKKA